MSTPTVLPAAALAQLAPTRATRPARLAAPALARAALWLSPVPLALAAQPSLSRVPWLVPVAALALAWTARAGLAVLGRADAGPAGAGPGTGARRVLAGFGLLALAWSVALPAGYLTVGRAAAELPLGYGVSLPVLALAAAATVGQVTGSEPTVLRWSLLPLAAAAATLAGWLPPPAGPSATSWLLPLAITAPLLRAVLRSCRPPAGSGNAGTADPTPPAGGCWRHVAAHALLAGLQAVAVAALWRAAAPTAAGGAGPVLLPLLLSLPLVELWASRHTAAVTAGLTRYDDRSRHQRHLRRLAWAAIAALLPPLIAGAALLATAHRLPYGLSGHPAPPLLMQALAAGVLLAGLLALGRLLAGRDRPGLAALVTAGPAIAAAVTVWAPVPARLPWSGPLPGPMPLPDLLPWSEPLPAIAAVLALAYPAGLVLATPALLDARVRTRQPAPAATASGRWR